MRRIVFIFTAWVVLAFVGCKRQLKLEGNVTGFKPGTDTLMLHVVSQKGATIFNTSIECIGKDCSGSLETFPAGHIRRKACATVR